MNRSTRAAAAPRYALVIDESLRERLEHLDAQRSSIEALLPDGLSAVLRERAQYESAHSSSVIEGNQLSFDQAVAAISDNPALASADETEFRQLNEAYEHAYRYTSDRTAPIDGGVIRALHSVLLRGGPEPAASSRGAYRRRRVAVMRSGETIYAAPEPEQVHDLMRAFGDTIADETSGADPSMSGPVLAALAHVAFVSIHPFEDGNGRMGRLISDMILDRTRWSFDRMLALSRSILDTRDEYYAALREVQRGRFSENGDATPFVEYQINQMCSAADGLQRRVVQMNRRIDEYTTVLNAGGGAIPRALSQRVARGIMYLLAVGPISTSTYSRLTESSQSTAHSDLQRLEEEGVVERTGSGRATRYRRVRDGLRRAQT